MNVFLKETELKSSGYGITIDFSKGDAVSACSSGLLLETGLVRMLEAYDYDSLDQIFPFLGALADVFCCNLKKPEVTRVFTLYIYLLRNISW